MAKHKSNRQVENFLERVDPPNVRSESTKRYLKLAILNSRRSANIGILLVAFPFLFVFGNIFKYNLGVDLGFVTTFLEWIMSLDSVPIVNWIIRIVLIAGPLAAVVVNLLAITHFYYDKAPKNEFNITFKVKWLNIIVIVFCGFVSGLFAIYLVAENLL